MTAPQKSLPHLLAAAVVALHTSCSPKPAPVAESAASGASTEPALIFRTELDKALVEIHLSDGQPIGGKVEPNAATAGEALAPERVSALLARTEALPPEPLDQVDFARRADSLPPPTTGPKVDLPFPAPPAAPPPEAAPAPFAVTRAVPDGKVPLAGELSVSFDQPMVALTGQDEASRVRPVRIDPEPPGQWRWLGTRTLVFEPEGRFPMATRYALSLDPGARSVNGQPASANWQGSFETPPPSLVSALPQGGPTLRQPIIALLFDQKVDLTTLGPSIELESGGRSHPWRAATPEEVQADSAVRDLIRGWADGRYVLLRSVEALPADAAVRVKVKAGAASAEGPLTTPKEQGVAFRTYGPLELREERCAWGGRCPPGAPWTLLFTNPLDGEAFDPALVQISPPLPEAPTVYVSGSWLHIQGRGQPGTTYTVQVGEELKDSFGQSMAKPATATFKVTRPEPAYPYIYDNGQAMTILDPLAKGTWPVQTVNIQQLKVRAWAASPEDWWAYVQWRNQWGEQQLAEPPGRFLGERRIEVAERQDELVTTEISLDQFGEKAGSQVIVEVVSARPDSTRNRPLLRRAWLQRSQIGLSVFREGSQLLVWANQLKDGAPIEGAKVEVPGTPLQARTDGSGLARLEMTGPVPSMVVASSGADLSMELGDEAIWAWNKEAALWGPMPQSDSMLWHVFDDRRLYRPGETARIKGWTRILTAGPRGDLSLPSAYPEGHALLSWVLNDSQGNEVRKGQAKVDALGGFDLQLDLPGTMNLGEAMLDMQVTGVAAADIQHTHVIEVQEFRRPEFEVKASEEQPGPHILGEHALVSASAGYFAGGPLPGATTNWSVQASPGSYQPPGWTDFRFGQWSPPWWGGRHLWGIPEQPTLTGSWSHEGRTDASGRHLLDLHFAALWPPQPMSVVAEATVQDVNRQTFSASQTLLLHPSAIYGGLRPLRPFFKRGQDVELELVAVDIDGKAVPGADLEVALVRREWTVQPNGQWKEKEAERHEQRLTAGAGPVKVSFRPEKGGQFEVELRVKDSRGRPNLSVSPIWVEGGEAQAKRTVEQEQLLIIPDQEEYQAGQTAELMVQAPWYPAEALVTWWRGGLLHSERQGLTEERSTLRVPIDEGMVPGLLVQVDLVGSAPREDRMGDARQDLLPRPAYAQGQISLKVPARQRTLTVEVQPDSAALSPGGSTSLQVLVKDAQGRPLRGAQVAVVAVDEAVLALTGYQMPDPIDSFYVSHGMQASITHSRRWIHLADPQQAVALEARGLGATGSGYGGGGAAPSGAAMRNGHAREEADESMPRPSPSAPPPMEAPVVMTKSVLGGAETISLKDAAPAGPKIALRSNFDALALFAPAATTDDSGRASLQLKLPDSLTRYRISAVAVAGERQFGKGESAVTARLPMMLRPSAPRFLNFGDQFELPLVIQNQTDAAMTVEVAVAASNARLMNGSRSQTSAGRKVTIPANDRVELRFPAQTERAGTARFQFVGAAGDHSDAARVELPVWTPATSEAFATYGELEGPQGTVALRQSVELPGEIWPQFGGLEISTSSTQVQALTDAVVYLAEYPYGCAEQIASRTLSMAALKDVLSAFQAPGLPAAEDLQRSVGRDLEELRRRQNPDGGWGFWRQGEQSWPFLTIHVAHALIRAEQKGFAVNGRMKSEALRYLRHIESHIPARWGKDTRLVLTAHALYVRDLAGDSDPRRARGLVSDWGGANSVPLEAAAWLLPTLNKARESAEVDNLLRRIRNQSTETASSAHFVTSYGDEGYLLLHSDRRADGLLLDALIQVAPKDPLIPKVVRGLLDHRVAGRWSSTQDNVWVLLALDRYFRVYESATPDFVARAWLGDRAAGEHRFKGRSTETARIDVPMSWLADQGAQLGDLTLAREGAGRMYYRLGLRYAPRDLMLEPADRGFVVERRYEAIDDPADVTQEADGTWVIKAGARVRVRLEMVADGRRTHVALVDPLPAGLEVLNPELKGTQAAPLDQGEAAATPGDDWGWWRWYGPWYEHENLRDERVEAFTTLLYAGLHRYTYVARATTPGTFVAPPARAEEMYHPETFGRSGTARVVVR